MRIEANIPHPHFKIMVYGLDNKYLIQIEAGPMMQSFKIGKEEVKGVEGIKQLLSSDFLSKVHNRFNEMYSDLNLSLKLCI